jgi:hypothetical protein
VIAGAESEWSGTVALLVETQPFVSLTLTVSTTSPLPSDEKVTLPLLSFEINVPCVTLHE